MGGYFFLGRVPRKKQDFYQWKYPCIMWNITTRCMYIVITVLLLVLQMTLSRNSNHVPWRSSFWITDQVKQNFFRVLWHLGAETLANYFTKHFPATHHSQVRPWYMHGNNSPIMLPHAAEPKALQGCVGTLDNGYVY